MDDATSTAEEEPQFSLPPPAIETLIRMAQVEVAKQQVGPTDFVTILRFHTPFQVFTIPLSDESVNQLIADLRGTDGSSQIVVARGLPESLRVSR